MKTIELRRSALTLMKKGLGKTNQEIAEHFGITTKEAVKVLESFGLIKGRKEVEQAYQISIVDDLTETIGAAATKVVNENTAVANA